MMSFRMGYSAFPFLLENVFHGICIMEWETSPRLKILTWTVIYITCKYFAKRSFTHLL